MALGASMGATLNSPHDPYIYDNNLTHQLGCGHSNPTPSVNVRFRPIADIQHEKYFHMLTSNF